MTVVQGALASEARLRWLHERLIADGAVTIGAAAAALGVSEMTIRRDLAELEERGTARPVRAAGRPAVGPQPFAERRDTAPAVRSHASRRSSHGSCPSPARSRSTRRPR